MSRGEGTVCRRTVGSLEGIGRRRNNNEVVRVTTADAKINGPQVAMEWDISGNSSYNVHDCRDFESTPHR